MVIKMSGSQRRCVFVGNIPYDATEGQLVRIFEEIGPVVSFRLVLDRETGRPKGYGFCEFRDDETALSARRNLQGYEINGRQLRVDFAENEKGSVDRYREQGRAGAGVGLAQPTELPKQVSVQRPLRDPHDEPVDLGAASGPTPMTGILNTAQVPAAPSQGILSSAQVPAAPSQGILSSAQVSMTTSTAQVSTTSQGILSTAQVSAMPSQGNAGNTTQQNGDGTASGTDALTNHLAGMPKHQLYQIVSQMKDLIQQNQQQAREILIANPQLTKTLFRAQIMLGMVRAPDTVSNQDIPVQTPQQLPTQPSQVQPMQVSSPVQSVQPTSISQQPINQTPQTGQLQESAVQMQPQIQSTEQPQAALTGLVQPNQFQHATQQHQPASMWSATILSHSQSAPQPGMQPQPPSHPPPLPQQPRPLVPPAQLQSQSTQALGFHAASGPQPYLSQPPFQQQQQSAMLQASVGFPFQMQPPLPSQPPPQAYQLQRNAADTGSVSMSQGGVMGMGGTVQVGRGPSIGVPSISATHMTWNQQIPSSGPMAGMPQAMASGSMAGHLGSAHHSLVGGNVFPAGGLTSTGPGPIQQQTGPGLIYSQGFNQPLAPTQPQLQSQQQIQIPLELEQQKALLQQVMNLTPEQLNLLSPEQRQQVFQLQQAFRAQAT